MDARDEIIALYKEVVRDLREVVDLQRQAYALLKSIPEPSNDIRAQRAEAHAEAMTVTVAQLREALRAKEIELAEVKKRGQFAMGCLTKIFPRPLPGEG